MYFDYMIEKETNTDTEEVTSFLKLPVYTRGGTYVGHVKNIFFDMDEKRVTVDVAIPYRWVNAVGDIVILSHFPERVETKKKKEQTEEEITEIDVVE